MAAEHAGHEPGAAASRTTATTPAYPAPTSSPPRATAPVPRPAARRLLTSRLTSCSSAVNTPGLVIATSRYSDATAA